MKVTTNEIDIKIDYKKLFNKFNFYLKIGIVVQKGEKYNNKLQKFLKKIKPLSYVMKNKDAILVTNKEFMIDEDSEMKILSQKEFKNLSLDIQVNLILGAVLSAKNNKYLPFTNIYGNRIFYLTKKEKNLLHTISFYVSLEDEKLLLNFELVAFRRGNKKSKGMKVTVSDKTLSYVIDEDKDEIFIRGNFPNQKIKMDFFVRDRKDFNKRHKIKFLYQFLEDLGKDIIKIEFIEKEVDVFISQEKKFKHYNKTLKDYKKHEYLERFRKILPKINIVNKSEINIKRYLKDEKIEFVFSDNISNIYPNIIVLPYDKEYYKANNLIDPYKIFKAQDKYSQVIIVDSFINAKKSETIVIALLRELAIKQDIKNKKMSALNKEIKFHKIYKPFGDKTCVFTINKDKNFDFEIIDKINENIIIEDFEGIQNIIRQTKIYPLPNINKLRQYLSKDIIDSTSFFAKSGELYEIGKGLIGFKYFIEKNVFYQKLYYSSGLNDNLNSTISKGFPFKVLEVKNISKDKLLIDEFLDSIDVFFININEYTIFPFYLKYINDFMKIRDDE